MSKTATVDFIARAYAEMAKDCDDIHATYAKRVDDFHKLMDGIEAELAPPARDRKDGFAPPSKPVAVECMHCGQRYSSAEIVFERRLRFRVNHILGFPEAPADLIGMWWCRNYECDGAGYGFDIHAKPDRRVRLTTPGAS